MKSALLLVDPQNDFFTPENPNRAQFEEVVSALNAAIAFFRSQSWPVVYLLGVTPQRAAGSPAWQVYSRFDHSGEDLQITTAFQNAFWNTALDDVLQSLGVERVVIGGFTSEYSVWGTLRGARERGYQGEILKEGIASADNRRTDFVLEICPSTSLEELQAEMVTSP